jgi:1,4-alpha-glucan branching enzyme
VPAVRAGGDRGTLAIVLHMHMPYVEGFGTWPFGEEWLWEAIAGCYLPLLDLLDTGAPLTLSLTPVLCDQLEAPGVPERFRAFVEEVRGRTHDEDAKGLRAAGHEALAREIERSWGDYAGALEDLDARSSIPHGGSLLGALSRHAQWTSSATHAVLPLLATDAGVGLQVHTGVAAYRERFGDGWRGGFWLPECAYTSWLGPVLQAAGASAVCVELTDRFGLGAREHLRPLESESGLLLVPIDRTTISLVWSDDGYPASGAYRDYHHHTVHHHNPWGNDGGVYDHSRALALVGEHAADFVTRTVARLRDAGTGLPGGGLVVCAFDAELFGHWWYEGLAWLEAVVEECSRQGLELMRLDDALLGREPAPVKESDDWQQEGDYWQGSSWGQAGNLSTWSGPAVAEMVFASRAAELELVATGARAGPAAVRELLALQSSDWAFMASRGLAVSYALERAAGHREGLERALAGETLDVGGLRNLAVHADPALLLTP